MPDKNYFDITIKHKYDSVTTNGKERNKNVLTLILMCVIVCSSLLIFSNDVSPRSEAKEDIKGKAVYFPTPTVEADRSISPCVIVTSTTSAISGKESETQNATGTSVSAVTNNTSKIKTKVTRKSTPKKEKPKTKKKTLKKKKQKKKSTTKKTFSNLTTKKKKAKAIWNTLKNEGYEEGAIAGVLGNIEQESNFNEKHSINNGSTYKGLFQLSKYDRFQNCINWCNTNGYEPWSVEGQTMFMIEEMNHAKVRTYQFKSFTGYDKEDYPSIEDPKKAASVFVAGYEGAISSGSGLNATWQQEEERRTYAQKWYDEFSSE